MSNYRIKVSQGRHLERWQKAKLKVKSRLKKSLKNPSYQMFQKLNLDYQLCDSISTQQKQILLVNTVNFANFQDGGLPHSLLCNIGGVRSLVDWVLGH